MWDKVYQGKEKDQACIFVPKSSTLWMWDSTQGIRDESGAARLLMLKLPLALALKHEPKKPYPSSWRLHGNSKKGTEALLLPAAKLSRFVKTIF